MGKKKANKKKRNEFKLIFFIILVAAALFIVSTYAWFSTQKNVSITNLGGIVEVAEGLEISLNGRDWYNSLPLGDGDGEFDIIEDSFTDNRNRMPSELLPVSTLGKVTETITDLKMLRGKLTNSIELSEIIVVDEDQTDTEEPDYYGYIAFDVFLKNSSKAGEGGEVLQLNNDSKLEIKPSTLDDPDEAAADVEARKATGLQNTARVGFALYTDENNILSATVTDQDDILTTTSAVSNSAPITDVAIWEPNANDHVQYIVNNNNKITWKDTVTTNKYHTVEIKAATESEPAVKGFGTTTLMPTYALSDSVLTKVANAKKENKVYTIANVYNWDGKTYTELAEQITVQTTRTSDTDYRPKEGVQNLLSANDPTRATEFEIPRNSIFKMRIYVWLEGQDVDCINYASHGGGINLDIGLVKGVELEPEE